MRGMRRRIEPSETLGPPGQHTTPKHVRCFLRATPYSRTRLVALGVWVFPPPPRGPTCGDPAVASNRLWERQPDMVVVYWRCNSTSGRALGVFGSAHSLRAVERGLRFFRPGKPAGDQTAHSCQISRALLFTPSADGAENLAQREGNLPGKGSPGFGNNVLMLASQPTLFLRWSMPRTGFLLGATAW